MSILLTGSDGFVGSHVQQVLDCEPLCDEGGIVDLRDYDRIRQTIIKMVPESVIHLAAQSYVPESFRNPRSTFDVNFIGTYNLLEALADSGFVGKFLYVSSSDVYGLVPENAQPIGELTQLRPRSPYAVSKVAAESLCFQFSQTSSFECIIARPFNHIGPGQDARFVISDFAKQLIEIKLGKAPAVMHVGDIDVSRDFTDVRNVVAAYKLLLDLGENSEYYNICSGTGLKVRDLIEMMIAELGFGVEIELVQDAQRFRKSEQRSVRGDNSRISNEIGWQPRISINQSIRDILKYWETNSK